MTSEQKDQLQAVFIDSHYRASDALETAKFLEYSGKLHQFALSKDQSFPCKDVNTAKHELSAKYEQCLGDQAACLEQNMELNQGWDKRENEYTMSSSKAQTLSNGHRPKLRYHAPSCKGHC